MERRGFLKTLAAALAALGIVKATPVESAPVVTAADYTVFGNPVEFTVEHSGKYDIIVSPTQKKKLDALRGQFGRSV